MKQPEQLFKYSGWCEFAENLENVYGLSPQECYIIMEHIGKPRTSVPNSTRDSIVSISDVRNITFVYHKLKRHSECTLTGMYTNNVFTFLVTNKELEQISPKPKRNYTRKFWLLKPHAKWLKAYWYNYKTKQLKLIIKKQK